MGEILKYQETEKNDKYEKLNEKEFSELFSNIKLEQGELGTCYLVSSLKGLSQTKIWKNLVSDSFFINKGKDGKINSFKIRIPIGEPGAKEYIINLNDTMFEPFRRGFVGGDGFQAIIMAYGIHTTGRNYYNPFLLEGGLSYNTIRQLVGSENIKNFKYYNKRSLNKGVEDPGAMKNFTEEDLTRGLRNVSKGETVILINVKYENGKYQKVKEGEKSNHVISVNKYNSKEGVVNIFDPMFDNRRIMNKQELFDVSYGYTECTLKLPDNKTKEETKEKIWDNRYYKKNISSEITDKILLTHKANIELQKLRGQIFIDKTKNKTNNKTNTVYNVYSYKDKSGLFHKSTITQNKDKIEIISDIALDKKLELNCTLETGYLLANFINKQISENISTNRGKGESPYYSEGYGIYFKQGSGFKNNLDRLKRSINDIDITLDITLFMNEKDREKTQKEKIEIAKTVSDFLNTLYNQK